MKSILPIIFIVLALTGAITYSLARRVVPKQVDNNVGISANQLENDSEIVTPTPTETTTFGTLSSKPVTPTPTPTVTAIPTVTEKSTTKGGQTTAQATKTTTTKTIVCTPVYGSANTCTEHIVVDTGAQDAIFFNFAGLAYLGGLLSFVKAKTLKK